MAWISADVKTAIQNTVGTISNQFDYRIIGTPLLKTGNGNQDYQVLAKTPSSLPGTVSNSKVLSAASQFSFFSGTPANPSEPEAGLRRADEFISAHLSFPGQTNGLFRQNAYLIIVLISNGKDHEVEYLNGNFEPQQNLSVFNTRKNRFVGPSGLKQYLSSKQFRLFSVTANVKGCKTGYYSSLKSYTAMSQALHDSHNFSANNNPYDDHYDLCDSDGISSVFGDINSTIQQITIPHKYNRWPITYTETATGLNPATIKVYKSSPTQQPTLLPASSFTYIHNPNQNPYDTRIEPLPTGEPTTSKHLIQFTANNEVTYPECVQITSESNPEYFGYVVIPKNPIPSSVVLKIKGQVIPQSATNGWSIGGYQFEKNIKVLHLGFSDLPEAKRTGHFINLNGSNNYYKSGDSVTIDYVPTN
jgi:hypothetical protein